MFHECTRALGALAADWLWYLVLARRGCGRALFRSLRLELECDMLHAIAMFQQRLSSFPDVRVLVQQQISLLFCIA